MTPLVKRIEWRCHACEHPVSAMTERAVFDAMEEHAEYVNRTANRSIDPHFADARMAELLAR